MSYPNKSKFIALYRAMQTSHPSADIGLKSLDEEQREQFDQFVKDAGNAFLEIKDELDVAIGELGDDFSHMDPRNWDGVDWEAFYRRVSGHKYEMILRLYAEGKPNIHLIWKEIENRL